MGQKREEKSGSKPGPKTLALAMQSTMPTLHRRCAQAAHTHTQAAHMLHKVENLQQVQQIHQIQKFQGILPRNLRRFQKCTAEQAGPQFKKFQRSQKIHSGKSRQRGFCETKLLNC